jgi:endothelin-converting enzyme/putative endopeptidase
MSNKTKRALLLTVFAVPAVCVAQSQAGEQAPKLEHVDVKNVDTAVNPCVNFHQYACGKVIASSPMPADEIYWGSFAKIALWNENLLRETLEKAATEKTPQSANEQKIGAYYAACMDERAIASNGLKDLQPLLSEVDAMKSNAQLASVLAKLHTLFPGSWQTSDDQTNAPMFGFGPTPDYNNAQSVIGGFDQGGLSLPSRDFYLESDEKSQAIRSKFLQYVARLLELGGEPTAPAEQDAKTVLAMETEMAKAQMDPISRRDPYKINHRLTLTQIKALAPSFNFDEYLKQIQAPASSIYLVTTPGFFTATETLIKDQPVEHWRTYLRFHLLDQAANELNDDFVNANFDMYSKTLFGAEKNQPRWRRCVHATDRDLGEALGQAYVEKAFPPASKQRMLTMIGDLKQALAQDIQQVSWMQPQTKTAAEKKLAAQLEKIGYPNKWRDYSALEITRTSYLENVERATAFESRRQMNKIGKPLDRMEWNMTPPTVNAYEDPQTNTINFPAGILQPPFFDPAADDAINYGAIGAVIGHETIHGFDDQGRKFDWNGDLHDWWTAEDKKSYEERGECIANEYTQFVPEAGVKQNGHMTQGEDTADNGGIHIALLAYEADLKRQGKMLDDKGADGLTNLQRFFLGYANDWCGKFRQEAMRTLILTNPHSLDEFRTNNVVGNMPEFATAYGCKAGQTMVHANACRVW